MQVITRHDLAYKNVAHAGGSLIEMDPEDYPIYQNDVILYDQVKFNLVEKKEKSKKKDKK